ncbi:uncharacterized protein BDCG_05375 [Blastomyces dermatitidis ER-3]|uniref:Uncharacterized protein n=1 Tax=Ajellomyces dermatitidis (strain ER-3 / ATCC MYA-2586) TaxID=559297 RepID=A0ABP2F0Q3_AJEDR|nr:uncharacterized protein BDCG_05375 [Blastomyces dermatitidis ER-3]EEQ90255.1 hypothetical protein BDCG_05375 [Blastomyces dermatitidis ER-3]EQL28958.1 hypothetical protein BDFG_08374 [Blastomyces dermatitidis ATCC 26199]
MPLLTEMILAGAAARLRPLSKRSELRVRCPMQRKVRSEGLVRQIPAQTGGKEAVAMGSPTLLGLNIYWIVESSKLSRAPLEVIVGSVGTDGRKETSANESRLSRTMEGEEENMT